MSVQTRRLIISRSQPSASSQYLTIDATGWILSAANFPRPQLAFLVTTIIIHQVPGITFLSVFNLWWVGPIKWKRWQKVLLLCWHYLEIATDCLFVFNEAFRRSFFDHEKNIMLAALWKLLVVLIQPVDCSRIHDVVPTIRLKAKNNLTTNKDIVGYQYWRHAGFEL